MDWIQTGFTEASAKNYVLTVTLTFDLHVATWFLFMAHRLVMMII